MNKNYTIRIYDNENKKFDETKERFNLREARTTVRNIAAALNKKYGLLCDPERFDIVIMKGKRFAFPALNRDLESKITNGFWDVGAASENWRIRSYQHRHCMARTND